MIPKKEMERKLYELGRLEAMVAEEWTEIRRLRALAEDISLPTAGERMGGSMGGDPVGADVLRRNGAWAEIAKSEKRVEEIITYGATLHRLMGEALTEDERVLIRFRGMGRQRWEVITRKIHLSRAQCCRVYMGALEKLCRAWEGEVEKES